MPKKNALKKLSPFQIFCICSLATLILMVGGTYLYVYQDNVGIFFNDVLDVVLIDKSIQDKPVKDMISYTLPSGWTEDTETSYLKETGTILLKSGDYKENSTQWDRDRNGVVISLDVSPKYRFQTLRSEKRNWKNSIATISDVTKDGIQGFKYEFNYRGSYDSFYFYIKDKYTIKIGIWEINRNAIDEKYWKDINSIIDSIQFR